MSCPWDGWRVLLAVHLVLVVVAYASGNAGGIFGPSIFLGAMLGGVVGSVANLWFDFASGPGAYALVGMGAAFAGILRVPMASVFMIFEITQSYAVIVPIMIANLTSFSSPGGSSPYRCTRPLRRRTGSSFPPRRTRSPIRWCGPRCARRGSCFLRT